MTDAAPGTLVNEDGRLFFYPSPSGAFGPAPKGHKHVMRIISWTLDGPLKVLMGCSKCSKTEVVKPSRRIRKIPEGFTEGSWAKLVAKADVRNEEIKRQAKAA